MPDMGATVPMVKCASSSFSTSELHTRANTATLMGTAMDTAEPRARSRMITASPRPMASAWSEMALWGWLRRSTTAPP